MSECQHLRLLRIFPVISIENSVKSRMEMIDRAIPEPHQSTPERCSAQGRTPDHNITPIRLSQHDILTRDRRAFPGAKTHELYVSDLASTLKRQMDGILAPF